MKYLFVTLMWNARAEMPVPGDIFAVCCQSYSPNGMTRYGRYTHLDDMSALTQWTKDAVYHNITVLETAKPRKEILNTVAETFPAYDVLVLWSRKEYELFRQAMHDLRRRARSGRRQNSASTPGQTPSTCRDAVISARRADSPVRRRCCWKVLPSAETAKRRRRCISGRWSGCTQ